MAAPTLSTDFAGRRWPLFKLSIRTGLLTVLTVGLYRFWMKTRLRRFYWSSIRPGGHPMEYVGQGIEKLLGFLIAVVILAFYIGIVNLLLMFVSFSLFDGNYAAYVASFVGVIPLWFYARYRARRYVLARTRWRGIRFGVDPGAWGYAWRAMLYWGLTILSGTLLWPLMTHRLEKYRIDRTWFGDRQLEQGGRWTGLIKGMIPFWIVLALVVGFVVWGYVLTPEGTFSTEDSLEALLGGLVISLPFLAIAFAWYSVRSFRVLTATKSAGPIRFESRARTPRVIGIYMLGFTATWLLTSLLAIVLLVAYFGLLFLAVGAEFSLDDLDNLTAPGLPLQLLGFAVYFLIFIIWGAFQHIFVTLPLWRHYAETLEIVGSEGLHDIRQRARDEHHEAEGFAEALDLGAAI
ncbi:YjgN family protein [Kangsaoukella pontilimi]|uniref:YjgN family protein n=1 Tax=Kangsaoukella pontilimi TaxID=2691042 RepID=UPI0029CA84D2|nr:DUF898 family protein [Kangsaoukella pontilimi]